MRRTAIAAVMLAALIASPVAAESTPLEQGVTPDHVRLALYNDLGLNGDMNAAWSPTDEQVGHEADFQQRYLVKTVKTLLRYFQQRYDTQGRTVQVIARSSSAGVGSPCSARQGDAAKIQLDIEPFAVIAMGGGEMGCFADYMASAYRRPTLLYGRTVDARLQRRHPGLIWSFLPSMQDDAQASAGFLCRKLAGRPARFTDDPTLKGTERRFGLAYPSRTPRGEYIAEGARALIAAARNRCGLSFDVETFVDAGTAEAPNIMNKWKRAGITTVVCYCIPVASELTATKFQAAAEGIAYLPEWYWDSAVAMDKHMWLQLFADRSMASFGSSHIWRQPALTEQAHVSAYHEQDPVGPPPNTRWSFVIYHTFLQAFMGLQNAGADLDTATLGSGLQTWSSDDRNNPFTPLGSYENEHAFVDSFLGWWWDPAASPPGGRPLEGCVRLVNEGAHYGPGTWPRGDADLFTPAAACTGPYQTAYL